MKIELELNEEEIDLIIDSLRRSWDKELDFHDELAHELKLYHMTDFDKSETKKGMKNSNSRQSFYRKLIRQLESKLDNKD